jgi:trimethylamine--corrinoid protein Co-methyltransferase
MTTDFPALRILSDRDVTQVDQAARQILRDNGIRVDEAAALIELADAGARVDRKSRIVCLDNDWLDEVLNRAPSSFTLCSRDGKNDLNMGSGRVHFGNGGRMFRVHDPVSEEYRPTLLGDLARAARLVEKLEHVQFFVIPCQAGDLDPENYHANDFFHSFQNTRKHVMGGCDDLPGLRQMWEVACLVAGGEEAFRQRPIASIITNSISPLIMDVNTTQMLRFACQNGIPATCAPAPISGATAPATLAGTLAQMHAEALAGVAIAQVFRPGARVLYGAVPATMDLRRMDYCMGSSETAMMNAAAVQMARFYRLPIYASAGVTESKLPDIQAGTEKTLSSLLVALSGADYIHLAAGMLDSGNTMSFEQYLIDDECIGMIQRILGGVRVEPDSLGAEAIRRAGPGGNYLLEDHTVENMNTEFFYPLLGVRSNLDVWKKIGRPDMRENARSRIEQLLSEEDPGLLDPRVAEDIRKAFPGIRDA